MTLEELKDGVSQRLGDLEVPASGGGYCAAFWPQRSRFRASNRALLDTLREIEGILANVPFTSGESTQQMIEDARSGAMYG